MERDESGGGWLVSIALYVAWLVTAFGAVIDALYVREAILSILTALQVIQNEAYHKSGGVGINFATGYGIALYDDIMLLVLGCGAIAAVVGIEYYFRKGLPKGLLYKRIGIVMGVEIAIFVVSIIIRLLV